ncbi:MAG: vitamin B12 transporter [Verrucomicrobiales bacterium]|jgi:vitamin B12 transporter
MTSHKRALCISAILLGTSAIAEDEETLAPTTIVSNRVSTPLHQSGSAVTVLDGAMLEEEQVFRLEDALRRSPGVFSESTGGQRGSVSSLFLRGTSTSQAHLQVDGVRLSDSTVLSNNFLGNAMLDGVGRIEILRGPQSALYGGESIGGVVGISSRRGHGVPRSMAYLEGGSFGSFRAGASSSGSFDDGLAYALGIGWETTDNDAQGTPELDHEQLSYALRLDYDVSGYARIGATFRGGHSEFHDPFGGENFTDYQLITLYGEFDVSDRWQTGLRIGAYSEAYDFGDPSSFATDAEKLSLGWENEFQLGEAHAVAFGALYEQTEYAQDYSFPADRDQLGLYATHVWEVTDDFTLTGGVRWEDYDDYGNEFTWRATAAYTFSSQTTIRASYGTAFRTPNLLELNGGPFEAGNPSLAPERSEGWDIGITQELGDALSVSVTWFENEVENLIVDPFGAAPSNTSGKGNANGLELALDGQAGDFRYGLAYTYLQRSLIGLPENVIEGHLHWDATEDLALGVAVSYVDERNLGGDPLEAYVLAKIYAELELTDNVSIQARVENAFDERYEHASFGGTPTRARRLGAFCGVTVTW